MDDEIDLRPYLRELFAKWLWLAALTVIGGVAAYLASALLLSPVYEATAMIIAVSPRYDVRLDSRLDTNTEVRANYYGSLSTLAMSDQALQTTLDRLAGAGESELPSLTALRSSLEAEYQTQTNLLALRAAASSGEEAAERVNAWAQASVDVLNALYGEAQVQKDFFEAELESARSQRDAASQALVAFEGENQSTALAVRLDGLKLTYSALLAERDTLQTLAKSAANYRQQLAGQPGAEPGSAADELTLLLLQLQAYYKTRGETAAAVQFTLPAAAQPDGEVTTAGLLRSLEGLSASLEADIAAINAQLPVMDAEILTLQQEITVYEVEKKRLMQEYDLAEDVYQLISGKLAETRLTLQEDVSAGFRLASLAQPPASPIGPRKSLNAILGAGLGFFLAFVGILARFIWRAGQTGTRPAV